MSNHEVSLSPKLLLAAVLNNLNLHFFDSSRDQAKQFYKVLCDESPAPFMKIDTGETGDVFCELSMDQSLYVGKLNYGKFRKSLASMMHAIKNRLEDDTPLNAMSSNTGEILFNIPGIVQEDNQVNIMVCSFRQLGPGLATVRLLYLDPVNYATAVKDANINKTKT